jgi:colicin import membrane protein
MIAREEFFPLLRAFVLALTVHALMVLLVVLGTFNWKPFRQPQPVGLTIEAVIVDTSAIREQREQAQRAAAEAEQRQQAQERRAQELEKQRQREKDLELKRQREKELEARRQQEAEVQRQKTLEEQRKKAAQDRLAALRLERERKLEAERQQQQRELEQARQQAAEAEKKRQLEAERLKQLEARKQQQAAEQQRKLEEAERQKKAAEEQRAAQSGRIAGLEDEYKAAIQSIVTQNWLRPPTAQAGLRCTLKIVQIPGGEVISAAIAGNCNGDEVTRRSIVAAVERAGVLPYRGFEDVFEKEIDFIFIYDGE